MRLAWLGSGEGASGGEGMYGVFSTRMMMHMVFNALHYDHTLLIASGPRITNDSSSHLLSIFSVFQSHAKRLNFIVSLNLPNNPIVFPLCRWRTQGSSRVINWILRGRAESHSLVYLTPNPGALSPHKITSLRRPLMVSSAWCPHHSGTAQCLGAWRAALSRANMFICPGISSLVPPLGRRLHWSEQSHFPVEVEGAGGEGFQVEDACQGQVLDHHCPLCGQVWSQGWHPPKLAWTFSMAWWLLFLDEPWRGSVGQWLWFGTQEPSPLALPLAPSFLGLCLRSPVCLWVRQRVLGWLTSHVISARPWTHMCGQMLVSMSLWRCFLLENNT